MRIEAETRDWVARELARLPFEFWVLRPAGLSDAVKQLASRLLKIAYPALST